MQTLIDCLEEVRLANRINNTKNFFGVFYYSKSNPSNHHYVVLASKEALQNLKAFHSEYDYIFIELTRV